MDKRYGKTILEEMGINVAERDIKSVSTHAVTIIEHEISNGTLPPDLYSHRDIVLIEMKDGTKYEALRETVDKDGNFSTDSAKRITREVRKIEE